MLELQRLKAEIEQVEKLGPRCVAVAVVTGSSTCSSLAPELEEPAGPERSISFVADLMFACCLLAENTLP